MPGSTFQELDAARAAVLAEVDRFLEALTPALDEALRRGLERLRRSQPGELDQDARSRVDEAIHVGVTATLERLGGPEIWLMPLTAPDLPLPREPGWGLSVPSWLAKLLQAGAPAPPVLGELDDPSNRIWVAIGAAAAPLDAVLERYGFRPEPGRSLSGGRFGVGPRTLPQLDPSGLVARRWRGYRVAYGRFSALLSASG